MRSFTDALGRTWSIEITVATLKRVRALAHVDLLDALGGNLLDRLVADPVLLGDIIYACVKPQADERKLTDEDVGRALAGDVIDAATTALIEEFVAFFPTPRRRVLEKVVSKLTAWRSLAIATAEARIDDPELERTAREAITSGTSSGGAPGLSASTPPS